jgi:hypothetical protein
LLVELGFTAAASSLADTRFHCIFHGLLPDLRLGCFHPPEAKKAALENCYDFERL